MADATIHHPKGDYVIRRRGNAIELTRELKASGFTVRISMGGQTAALVLDALAMAVADMKQTVWND